MMMEPLTNGLKAAARRLPFPHRSVLDTMGDEMGVERQRDLEAAMDTELRALVQVSPPQEREAMQRDMEDFKMVFQKFLENRPSLDWEKIQKLPEGAVEPYEDLRARALPSDVAALLNRLVVVKLNGASGSHMGFQGPHSLLGVRDESTFLDLAIEQIEHLNEAYDCDIPLVLMNSFLTNEEILKILQKYSHRRVKIKTFMQSRYPRVHKETLLPAASADGDEEQLQAHHDGWYLPGHGDFYESFHRSGLLDDFLQQGKEVMFISNMDNLGASVDLHILHHLLEPLAGRPRCEFVMEVTDKTRADMEGGTLIHYEDKLRLLEIAQVPSANIDEFRSVSKFKIFNTNNLWISLEACKRLQESGRIDMEVIANQRMLSNGLSVIQLERAVGAAMKCFDNALGISVPRSRFLPVKKTADLLLVQSNLYTLRGGAVRLSERREFPTVPLVKLGDEFTKVQDFLKRFASIPDILELDHLTVSGNVTFGKNVVLKGTVIIIANHGDKIAIPSGSILENKIISGNLSVLDH
ncbi:UTP--glucose-1-phosphate uridylyltransferase-like isoform X1 [Lethenteron reissneri]|uniref:UTP--glucose-1-phosphate uridylyltransferase-like isoform X1 n=2 Tax=Lethenteron reissneri TaxID=7753 RepID=UPI002AB63858|nr:UTP--glucose-1-phosphate uridylyltransferase-like isoform X1 [Lethenteron reissneri]